MATEKKTTTETVPPTQENQTQNHSQTSITTKTTPAKNDLLATIDTGVLHLSTNKDAEEKKLSLDNMHLQE
eukprot:3835740-Amphidinium_carterae.1